MAVSLVPVDALRSTPGTAGREPAVFASCPALYRRIQENEIASDRNRMGIRGSLP